MKCHTFGERESQEPNPGIPFPILNTYAQWLTSSFFWVGCAGIFPPFYRCVNWGTERKVTYGRWGSREVAALKLEPGSCLLASSSPLCLEILFSAGGVLPCLQFFLRVESPLCFQASGFPFLPFCHTSNSPQASSPLLALVSLSLKWASPFSHSYLGCCHFSPSLSDWASTAFSQTLARNCT